MMDLSAEADSGKDVGQTFQDPTFKRYIVDDDGTLVRSVREQEISRATDVDRSYRCAGIHDV